MDDVKAYLESTGPATEGLFNILNNYAWSKLNTLVERTEARKLYRLNETRAEFEANDVARDVISGAILQIAYAAIDKYSSISEKPSSVHEFEQNINSLAHSLPNSRLNKNRMFDLPLKFCIGRKLGILPMGVIVYAGRMSVVMQLEQRAC